jgi:hypothetical protein
MLQPTVKRLRSTRSVSTSVRSHSGHTSAVNAPDAGSKP